MPRRPFADHSIRRLRALLMLFFLALAIPTGVLLKHSYSQLKWETFHNHRLQAEALLARIDQRYAALIDSENARAFTDYAFRQKSTLSTFPVQATVGGTLGYFQIDHAGRFSTPLLPMDEQLTLRAGVSDAELSQRRALHEEIYAVLTDNRLIVAKAAAGQFLGQDADASPESLPMEADDAGPGVGVASPSVAPVTPELEYAAAPPPASPAKKASPAQSAFDELSSRGASDYRSNGAQQAQGRAKLEDLNLDRPYEARIAEAEEARERAQATSRARTQQPATRSPRKEQNVLLEEAVLNVAAKPARVDIFESEVDALQFSLLDSGHFVLYRNVWRDERRYIQGLLIDAVTFIDAVVGDAFYQAGISRGTNLAIAYQGNVVRTLAGRDSRGTLTSAEALQGTLLLQRRLTDPLSRMEIVFSASRLPAGPGGRVLAWTALVLLLVFSGGFFLLYRLGLRQIRLARQQQDFVSAVSHELKTPLTSIRMYGEMLREGWAPEEKRKTYYDYIFHESERLTRLINNVLQLARMSRNDLHVELKPCSVAALLDTVRSKVSSQVERAGFDLNVDCDTAAGGSTVEVDVDYVTQIIINLVDNALKFSAKAQTKRIDIECRHVRNGKRLQISVRDYGPGIPKDQLRKIFRLFYRMENELTRETVGTGIGLALVRELIDAMHAEIDVVNQSPGAEFRIVFPCTRP